MSSFDQYEWRETYFVFFSVADRPPLDRVRAALAKLDRHFEFSNEATDEAGLIESLSVHSPADASAMEISYEAGDEVRGQLAGLVKELSGPACAPDDREKLPRLRQCDARLDVMHFEELASDGEEEHFDPGALLQVLEVLAKLTRGIGVDPQSGALV